jgi:phenylacetate-CoA ligase
MITEQFGIPLIALYNAVESFKIGFMCEEGKDYHLHEDLCHVKIVDKSGKTVADDEQGEVIISNLVNRATVLLNYRLGDFASRTSRTCACGRT